MYQMNEVVKVWEMERWMEHSTLPNKILTVFMNCIEPVPEERKKKYLCHHKNVN